MWLELNISEIWTMYVCCLGEHKKYFSNISFNIIVIQFVKAPYTILPTWLDNGKISLMRMVYRSTRMIVFRWHTNRTKNGRPLQNLVTQFLPHGKIKAWNEIEWYEQSVQWNPIWEIIVIFFLIRFKIKSFIQQSTTQTIVCSNFS